MAETVPVSKGEGSLAWSTGSVTDIAGLIVESFDPKPRNNGPLSELENENGKRIGLEVEGCPDGFQYDQDVTITGKAKSTLTPPAPGTKVVLTPKTGGTAYNGVTVSPMTISRKRKQYCDVSVVVAFSSEITIS